MSRNNYRGRDFSEHHYYSPEKRQRTNYEHDEAYSHRHDVAQEELPANRNIAERTSKDRYERGLRRHHHEYPEYDEAVEHHHDDENAIHVDHFQREDTRDQGHVRAERHQEDESTRHVDRLSSYDRRDRGPARAERHREDASTRHVDRLSSYDRRDRGPARAERHREDENARHRDRLRSDDSRDRGRVARKKENEFSDVPEYDRIKADELRRPENDIDRDKHRSSSRSSSRVYEYIQDDMDKAYKDLVSLVLEEGVAKRYSPPDDLERRLPNLWEGVEGMMEHVVEKLPMPEIMNSTIVGVESDSRLANIPSEIQVTSENLEPVEDSTTDGLRMQASESEVEWGIRRVRNEMQNRPVSQDKSNTTEGGRVTSRLGDKVPNMSQSNVSDHMEIDEKQDKNYEEDQRFVVLDDAYGGDKTGGGEDGDLLLALGANQSGMDEQDPNQGIDQNIEDMDTIHTSRNHEVSQNEGDGINTVSSSSVLSLEYAPSNPVGIQTSEQNLEQASSSSSNHTGKQAPSSSSIVKNPQNTHPLDGHLELLEHKSWDLTNAAPLLAEFKRFQCALICLHGRFTLLKAAAESGNERNGYFSFSNRDLENLSEIGWLIPSFFSEVEIFRMTLTQGVDTATLNLPNKICPLSRTIKDQLTMNYTDLKRRMADFIQDFNDFIQKGAIIKHNDKAAPENGITKTHLFFFNRGNRYQRFLDGKLPLYKVSSVLTTNDLDKPLLNSTQRKDIGPLLQKVLFGHDVDSQKYWKRYTKLHGMPIDGADADGKSVGPGSIEQTIDPKKSNLKKTQPPKPPLKERKKGNILKNKKDPEPGPPKQIPWPDPIAKYKMSDSGFQSPFFDKYDRMAEQWRTDFKYVKSRLMILCSDLAKDRATGHGPQTTKACSELVQLSIQIGEFKSAYDYEKKCMNKLTNSKQAWYFPVNSPQFKQMGQHVCQYLSSKFNSIHSMIETLHFNFSAVFCRNFEAIILFNRSKAAQEFGMLTMPPRIEPVVGVDQRIYASSEKNSGLANPSEAYHPQEAVSHGYRESRKRVFNDDQGYELREHGRNTEYDRFDDYNQEGYQIGMDMHDGDYFGENSQRDRSKQLSSPAKKFRPDSMGSRAISDTHDGSGSMASDERHGLPVEFPNVNPDDDPLTSNPVHCRCTKDCRGKILPDVLMSLDESYVQSMNEEELYWERLVSLLIDMRTVSFKQSQLEKLFDKLNRQAHKNATQDLVDVTATLPHIEAVLKQLKIDILEKGFPSFFGKRLERHPKTNWFTGSCFVDVEKFLEKLYTTHNEFYFKKKMVIYKWFPHADFCRNLRFNRSCYQPQTQSQPDSNPENVMGKKKKKANDPKSLLAQLNLSATNNKDTNEKLRYYQVLFKVQQTTDSRRKQIAGYVKTLNKIGLNHMNKSGEIIKFVKKLNTELLDLRKEIESQEPFKEKYGMNVPRYIQAMLKMNDTSKNGKGGKKTANNHIRNYKFNLTMISMAGRELRAFVKRLDPSSQWQLKDLPILNETDARGL